MPATSTGAYGYPLEAATRIAIDTVCAATDGHDAFDQVVFCCFSVHDLATYERLLAS